MPVKSLAIDYDMVPGYEYFRGLLLLYPGASLGMEAKGFNNKVSSLPFFSTVCR